MYKNSPTPLGQAEPAVGVAAVEWNWGDEEVEAGRALVLRLQGVRQLACNQQHIEGPDCCKVGFYRNFKK